VQWLEEVPREGRVIGSNPAGRVAANFARKMPRLRRRRALTRGGLPRLKKNYSFFRFELCRVSGTQQTLCRVPEKKTRQKQFCRQLFLPSVSLCRVQSGALGKAPNSGMHGEQSDLFQAFSNIKSDMRNRSRLWCLAAYTSSNLFVKLTVQWKVLKFAQRKVVKIVNPTTNYVYIYLFCPINSNSTARDSWVYGGTVVIINK
jgi:hypothetical protein